MSSAERAPRVSPEAGPALLEIHAAGMRSPRDPVPISVAIGATAAVCTGAVTALPFLDGAFDDVALSCPYGWFEDESAERMAREIERVVRPDGRYSLRIEDARSSRRRRRIERTLDRAGLELDTVRDPAGVLVAQGRRRSGVSAQTWRELAGGGRATAWNDSMFAFQQTPYDPATIAGRIFLSRVRWIARAVGAREARVLEVGCEAGGLLRHLAPGLRIVGLDLSGAALRAARQALPRRDVSFVHADATQPLPFRAESFDFVIASEVLEHCRSPHRVIAHMHAVLRRDGRAILSVPNERRYLRWKRWLSRLPLARLALRGIEEGPAAWHIHHDFDHRKLAALIDGFFAVETQKSIWGTTLISVLRKVS